MELDEDQAAGLAGGDVRCVADARDVEHVPAGDVTKAEAEAAEAAQRAAQLEVEALGDPGVDHGAVVAAKEASRFARMRAALVARRAERARQAGRLLALEAVGADLDDVAAGSAPDVTAAATALAEASRLLRRTCQAHDAAVQSLITRAETLGAEDPTPDGQPRASSAHLMISPDRKEIRHGATAVRLIGDHAQAAVAKASEGDVDGAVAVVAAVHQQADPVRAQAYFKRSDGMVFAGDDSQFEYQLNRGELVRLTDKQTALYLEGKLDGQH